MSATMDIGYWEQENGFIDNSEEIEELQEQLEELEEDTEEYTELQERIEELEEEQENLQEIYQCFIVSDRGAEIIKQWTNEILFYNKELDMYVWGVTHLGTSWDYVLTDIKLNCGKEA